jgi:hypothetical protein
VREILFRGFHENKSGESVILVNGAEKRGTWVEGSLIKSESGHCYIGEWLVSSKANEFHCAGRGGKTANRYLGMGFVLVIPETVGEFTGRLDKDKRMIFEGDLISGQRFYVAGDGYLRKGYPDCINVVYEVKYHRGILTAEYLRPTPEHTFALEKYDYRRYSCPLEPTHKGAKYWDEESRSFEILGDDKTCIGTQVIGTIFDKPGGGKEKA